MNLDTPLTEHLERLALARLAAHEKPDGALADRIWKALRQRGWRASPPARTAVRRHVPRDDTSLLTAWLAGDESAFDELMLRHQGALLGYAKRWLDDAAAKDAVQNAFVALFQKAGEIVADGRPVRGFLFRATHFEATKMLRAAMCLEAIGEDNPPPADGAPRDALHAALRSDDLERVLDALERRCNPLEQQVILADLDDLDTAEIARRLELEPGHVRVLRNRALAKLRTALQDAPP